jgi:hypothetical protein
MGIERLQPTEEQKQFLVTAIERDNASAVAQLIKRFGLEVWLTHKRYEKRDTGTVIHAMAGTPVHIAAFLGKDALAVLLLQQGAQRWTSIASFGTAEEEADGESELQTVALVEHAVRNKLPLLTRALMELAPDIDWNHLNSVTSKWGGTFNDDTLFDKFRTFKDNLDFVGQVGLFAGLVRQSQVKVAAVDGTFEVRINGCVIGYYPTMASGIAKVAATLGLEPITPLATPPAPPATDASLKQRVTDSVVDDIPY